MENDALLRKIPELLLPWYRENARLLPWRRDREPYHVWLSEIMLQQTRVEAVRGYYTRFLQALPTLESLAAVPDDRLMKLWEGLGYYSRARNLKRAAGVVVDQFDGRFPSTYEEILSLPGVGPYTAGAIASICFDLPCPAVDGNVLRVYARLLAMDRCVDLPEVKGEVTGALAAIYRDTEPRALTQALMELGATVCLPRGGPKCAQCPLAPLCRARASGTQLHYPVKAKKRDRRVEDKTVFILRCRDRLAVIRREGEGLLGGLWQLPNVPGKLDEAAALDQAARWNVAPTALDRARDLRHIFTHVQWEMTGYYIRCKTPSPQFHWAGEGELAEQVALPTAFKQFLE